MLTYVNERAVRGVYRRLARAHYWSLHVCWPRRRCVQITLPPTRTYFRSEGHYTLIILHPLRVCSDWVRGWDGARMRGSTPLSGGFSPAYTPARTQSLASVLNELVPVHARGRIWVYRSGSVDVRSWEGELIKR